MATGANSATLESGEFAGGTIDTVTGEIIGSATTLLSNDLTGPTPLIIRNFVSGNWPPAGTNVTMNFSGPAAATPPGVPALGAWGPLIIVLSIMLIGSLLLFRRRLRAGTAGSRHSG